MTVLINLCFEKLRSLEAHRYRSCDSCENKFQLALRCEWKQFFEFRTIIQSIVNGSNALF